MTLNSDKSGRGSNIKYLPFAFTFDGIKILPNILRKENVIEVTSIILDAFNDERNELIIPNISPNPAVNYVIEDFIYGTIFIEVTVSPKEYTVWLTKDQLCILFQTTRQNIEYHINNIYESGELDERATCKKNLQVQYESNRFVNRYPPAYNMDMFISLAYRIHSDSGIVFRKWAINVLKEYMIKGYSIDTKRCLEHSDTLTKLSNELTTLVLDLKNYNTKLSEHDLAIGDNRKILIDYKKEIDIIKSKLDEIYIDDDKRTHIGILNGKKFKADILFQDIYKKANHSIIIIDDYIDIKTIQLLKSSKDNISIIVISDNKAKNSLNKNFIEDSKLNIKFIRNDKVFHDRYIILDYKTNSEVFYHLGSSSKDSGNKITAINITHDTNIYYDSINEILSKDEYKIE